MGHIERAAMKCERRGFDLNRIKAALKANPGAIVDKRGNVIGQQPRRENASQTSKDVRMFLALAKVRAAKRKAQGS